MLYLKRIIKRILKAIGKGVYRYRSQRILNDKVNLSCDKELQVIFGKKIHPEVSFKDRIQAEVNRISSNVFNLLGSGDVNLGVKIDWHCDFKTGYRWNPHTFYDDIEIPQGKADIKVPWELSRFQHLIPLGIAYNLTKDKKYTREFVDEVIDWIAQNPLGHGVNWRCAMDVAIRASNWIAAYDYFKDSGELSDAFREKFTKNLYLHGKHIRWNLEKGWRGLTSNHYLSDIAGLVYLGMFFRNAKPGRKWLGFGVRELKKEMRKQVYDDGCDFEASTCYHRLVLELFFYCTLLVVINDQSFTGENHKETAEKCFGKVYTERLYKMFDAVCYLLKPNGKMPQIGDNDSGQFFKFYPREVLDMRYLLSLGAVFFKEPRWKIREFFTKEEDIAEVLVLYGEGGKKVWDSLTWNGLEQIGSKAFKDAGWYVMRYDKNYCIVSCSPNGQNGRGGHCHNDKLSFELQLDGEDVIVDPGTYLYTPDPGMRNKFRSTASHNTVMVDDEEQNRFDLGNIFELEDRTKAKCVKWESNSDVDVFVGEHYGYERLPNPVIHRRQIKFLKKQGKLEIIDSFNGKGGHEVSWNFVLSPEFKGELSVFSDELSFNKTGNFYSPEYGRTEKTYKMSANIHCELPYNFKVFIKRL